MGKSENSSASAASDPSELPHASDEPSSAAFDHEAFRRHGHALVDWIADYWAGLEERPAQPDVRPGDVRAALPATPPEEPEPFARVLEDLDQLIAPALTHWQHPRFFGYFPANVSGPSVLGDLAAAGLGTQGMSWATGPAATELETLALDWLAELLGLPDRFRSDGAGGGVIQDSASSATLVALLAARERATGGAARTHGIDRPLAVYATEHAHSSVTKAARIAGLGESAVRHVGCDDGHRLDPVALGEALAADRRAGVTPCAVIATVGTTSSGAVDPVAEIADVLAGEPAPVWLHVDAAWAGVAAVAPEHRNLVSGAERADSWSTNPHKWLLTNFDCDAFWVADRGPLLDALAILPEYLRTDANASGDAIDYRDWQVPLGRRFRALKLWFVLRGFGASGLRAHIRRHVDWAAELAQRIEADPHLELAAPRSLALVCLRHRDGEDATARVLEAANEGGRAVLTHTRLGGRLVVRVAIGSVHTARWHVRELADELSAAAEAASRADGLAEDRSR
ncbi:aspartate aminotransferase family protein [Egibacter rhizosphaerae]|uniref:Aspartate aminotransferase family protein n=1 Tax=Egibacter rhizosphaerae TaxID=1670831 RepID=A0A411YKB6_9ACTN|nr:pyridoxal-dependent decarboxylase [Egibacter rhizosphaerae]QBI21659.1 aspartate aminotransferase family protein [Egibacter rhizosphaerae]